MMQAELLDLCDKLMLVTAMYRYPPRHVLINDQRLY